LSRNFLDLKKELRDKVDLAVDKNHDLEKSARDIMKKIEKLEKSGVRTAVPKAKKKESINVFKPEMTIEESDRILEEILGEK